MELEAKIIVTFVWGIIIFEASSFLSLYAPLLYRHVSPSSLRTFQFSSSSCQHSWQWLLSLWSVTTKVFTLLQDIPTITLYPSHYPRICTIMMSLRRSNRRQGVRVRWRKCGGTIVSKVDLTCILKSTQRWDQIVEWNELLLQMRFGQRTEGSSLQSLQKMHSEDGPSLPLGRQLCGKARSQIFHSLSHLRHCNSHLM